MALDNTDLEHRGELHTAGDATRPARRRFAAIALLAASYTFLLISFGGIVRITGSGLGCGDDWPRCNGQWIPLFDLETFIEWFHRLLAAGMLLPVGAMLAAAWLGRHNPGFGGRGGLLRLSGVAMAMLLLIATLGMVTVKLELPAAVTAMHFGLANLLLALLLVAAIRAGAFTGRLRAGAAGRGNAFVGTVDQAADQTAAPTRTAARKFAASATAAAGVGFVLLILGALTANVGKTPGVAGAGPAAWACGVVDGSFLRSFPLCNGRILPSGGGGLVHIHWTHRLVALLLSLHVVGAVIAVWRKRAPANLRWAATAVLGVIVAQLVIAAHLILFYLPLSMQVLHLVAGVAVWAALVIWAALARDYRRQTAVAEAPARSAVPT